MSKGQEDQGTVLVVGMFGIAVVVGFSVVAGKLGVGFAIPVGIALAVAAAVILTGPLGKAIARVIEHSTGAPHDPEAVEELAKRVEQLEREQARMAELEERVDFAERLLVRHRDAEQLGRG